MASIDDSFDIGLVTSSTLDHEALNAAPEHWELHRAHYDFLLFLGTAQHLGIDFIPITWHSVLEGARRGRTAAIQQMAIDLQNAFAFKRLSSQRLDQRAKDLPALIAELAVLGHPAVRDHPHLSRLEGICWDITSGTDEVWPVLVFEKASHGDLMSFMERGPGRTLIPTERLALCGDIAGAIIHMHMNSIIHGDIKPQNVLVVTSASQRYTAKVCDFGYSTIFASADARIKMPRSENWVAPEWSHWNSITNPEGARKMDVFSLGALCLWLLFYNNGDENGATSRSTLEFFAQLRSETDVIALARQHISESDGFDEEKRKILQVFFEHSLQHDPALRDLKENDIMNLTSEHTQGQRLSTNLMSEVRALNAPQFKVANSIAQLYLADYRVRKFVTKCLKEITLPEIQLSGDSSRAKVRALQLALCYKIGFGTEKDAGALSDLLQKARIRSEALEDMVSDIKGNSDQPIFRSRMYSDLVQKGQDYRVDFAEGYAAEGQLESAVLWSRREAADIEEIFGPANPLSLITKIGLYYVLRKAGSWDEAMTLRRHVTQLLKDTKGERDPETLASMSQQAALHIDKGELDDAQQLLLHVRSIQESTFGSEHAEVLETVNALAGVYRGKGRFKMAEDILLPAIEIRTRLLGPEHPDTLRLISSLAATYLQQHRLKEAEQLLKRLVEIRKARFGLKNTMTLSNMSNLASIYYNQEKFEEAKVLYGQVFHLRMELFGEEHQETLVVLSNLATVSKKTGDLGFAQSTEEKLLKLKIRVFGEESISTLTTQGNLALTYAYRELWEDAKTIGLKVVYSKRKIMGPDHPSTLRSILNLADAYEALGEKEEAKAVLKQGMQDAVAADRTDEFETKAIMEKLLEMTEPDG